MDINKALVIGDVHGDTQWAQLMVQKARANGCDVILQLGDFGIWPGAKGDKFLNHLNRTLVRENVTLFFVDGNHEDFPKLARLSKPLNNGFMQLRIPYEAQRPSHIYHIPRGHVWNMGGKRFMGVGGGVSIDRNYRIIGQSWWPQEQLTPQQIEWAKSRGKVDVLLSHDCPNTVPMKGIKNDIDSYLHRKAMEEIADVVQPDLWLHGHMHEYMEYEYKSSRVIGLNRNTFPDEVWFENAWGILYLPSLEFEPEHLVGWLDKAY